MEAELAAAVAAQSAEGGTGIVLDVATGEIVAMASAPTFNPNTVGRADPSALYNRATMGVYELGSTFKPITVAAAIDAGVVTSMAQRWDAATPVRDRPLPDHATTIRIGPVDHRAGDADPFLERRHRPDRRPDGRRRGCRRCSARSASTSAPHIELRRARPAALAERMEPGDDADHRLRPWHRGDPAASRQRLCRAGQRRHLAAGDPAAGRARPGRRRAAGCSAESTSARMRQLLG